MIIRQPAHGGGNRGINGHADAAVEIDARHGQNRSLSASTVAAPSSSMVLRRASSTGQPPNGHDENGSCLEQALAAGKQKHLTVHGSHHWE